MNPVTGTPPPAMKRFRLFALLAGGALLLGLILVAAAYLYIEPRLPPVDALQDVRLQVPLRIFTADRRLIGEFGEKRRIPVTYATTPKRMIQALLAAEDDRFFHHPGVDYQGLLRAAYELIRTGQKRQGGSTITMQVARNFFLSRKKTYLRKLTEIFLALKIEHELTKQQILELYMNKIYLGHRAYGVGAAAQVYYGRDLDQLSLPEIAMIAGLPKAPSRDNPITDPRRALRRRNYVLGRMHELGFISDAEYRAALATPDDARLHTATSEVDAPYVSEMVRAQMVARYGAEAYTGGYQVVTTIDSRLEAAATRALRRALLAYDRRHGYRGAVAQVDFPPGADAGQLAALIADRPPVGGLRAALVTAVAERSFTAVLKDASQVRVDWPGMAWARPYETVNRRGPKPTRAADLVQPGDVVYLERRGDDWWLAQPPQVEGALIAVRPGDGAVLALSGGFDFARSKFNRVTQARRQPGSSFKPFIYSAALEKGFTAASVLNDAPVVFDDPGLERAWRPENYEGRFYGPTRLREALVHSRNLVSIRLLRAIGVDYAIDYATRFGFRRQQLPRNLSLALGSGSVTPWQMAGAYAVFANGGYRVEPYFIGEIEDSQGKVLYRADPYRVCEDCAAPGGETDRHAGVVPTALHATAGAPSGDGTQPPGPAAAPAAPRVAPRVIPAANDWIMDSMLRDVIRHGTGRRARVLGRHDLAGKTGTTNDQRDAWFCGFTPRLVTISWVGFDDLLPLGNRETGARAALPMWIDFMRAALAGIPEDHRDPPPGLVTVRIDPATGQLAPAGAGDAIFETFREGHVPTRVSQAPPPTATTPAGDTGDGEEPLF